MRFATLIAAAALAASTFAHSQMMTPSYGGLWWKSPAASESGWGLNITHQGDILFATWFTYDRDGNGMWLVIPQANLISSIEVDPYYGGMSGTIDYQGAVYRTTGPAFDSTTFNPSAVTVTQVGNAFLKFSSGNLGTFTYTVDGVSGSKVITRQSYSSMPTCELGGPRGTSSNFQDLWWRSPAGSESGWGVNLTHQGDIIFATWFTYDSTGKGMWLVMSDARKTGPNAYSGAMYRTNGPSFDTPVWDGTKVRATQVGTGTLTFSDASNGSFAYTVNGVSQAKAITRQVFANPATVCR